jgi:hypothetical protein
MESLRFDVDRYGIRTTIVEPGFFRSELLVEGASTIWPELSIDDYLAHRVHDCRVARHEGPAGRRPRQLAAALVTITELDDPPLRWVAGAVAAVDQKAKDLLAQVAAHRELPPTSPTTTPSSAACRSRGGRPPTAPMHRTLGARV